MASSPEATAPPGLKSIVSGTIVYALSAVLSAAVGLLVVPVYTSAFVPSEYGVLSQFSVTTALATILVSFGLDNSAAVWFFQSPSDDERRKTFSSWLAFTLGIGGALGLLSLLASPLLARFVLHDVELAHLWRVYALTLVLAGIPRIGNLWFRNANRPVVSALLSLSITALTGACGALLVTTTSLGVKAVLLGQVAGFAAGAVATLFMMRGVLGLRWVERGRLVEMLRFSYPLVGVSVLTWLMSSAVLYWVNQFCSQADAGLYSVGASLAGVISLATFAFAQAWSPFALSIGSTPQGPRIIGLATETYFAAMAVAAFLLAGLALPLLELLPREAYAQSHWVTSILGVNALVAGLPQIYAVTFSLKKSSMPLARATAFGALTTVVVTAALIGPFGKEGAAVGVVTGTITYSVVGFAASQRLMPIQVNLTRVGLVCLGLLSWGSAFVVLESRGALAPVRRGVLLVTFIMAVALIYRTPVRSLLSAARKKSIA